MIKRNLGKVLSLVLAATLTFTSAIPSYAMDASFDAAENVITSEGEDLYEDSTLADSESDDLVTDQDAVKAAEEMAEDDDFLPDSEEDTDIESETVAPESEESQLSDDVISETTEDEATLLSDDEEQELTVVINFEISNVPSSYADRYNYFIDYQKNVTPSQGGKFTLTAPEVTSEYSASQGYRFVGFTTTTEGIQVESDGLTIDIPASAVQTEAFAGFCPTIPIYLEAHYSNRYDVVCDLGGGTYQGKDSYNTSIAFGDRFSICLPDPVRPGYEFDYWSSSTGLAVNGDTYMDTSALYDLVADGKIRLTAHWEPATIDILFYSSKGGFEPGAQYPKTTKIGQTTGKIDDPVYAHHTFVGWNSKRDGTGMSFSSKSQLITEELYLEFKSPIYDNTIVIYDVTTPLEYTVKFDPNYPEHYTGRGEMYDFEFNYDQDVKLPPCDYIAEGLTFAGWALGPEAPVRYKDEHRVQLTDFYEQEVTLYAKWSYDSYVVRFNPNPPNGRTVTPDSYAQIFGLQESKALYPNTFSCDGYHFNGWITDPAATQKTYNDGQTVSKLSNTPGAVIDLYALWEPDQYYVRFWPDASQGHEIIGNMEQQLLTIDKPEKLSKNTFKLKGYDFAGWSKSRGGEKSFDDEEEVVNILPENQKRVSLYTLWTPKDYYVTFDPNAPEGETITGTMESQKHTFDSECVLSANLFKSESYSFAGWSKTSGGKVQFFDKESVVNLTADGSDITLYAVWKPLYYYVEFDANPPEGSSIYGLMDDQTLLLNKDIALSENRFYSNHTNFLGWAKTPDGDVEFADGATVRNLTDEAESKVTLYAVWERKNYYIRFDPNPPAGYGASGTMERQTLSFDLQHKLTLNAYSVSGFTFLGWSKTAGGNVVYSNGATVRNVTNEPEGEVTLYAVWGKNNYTVRFFRNDPEGSTCDGSMPDETFRFDERKTLLTNEFSALGYIFEGWALTPTGEKVYDDGAVVLNLASEEGTTVCLYALWKPCRYNVRFNANAPEGRSAQGQMADQTYECHKQGSLSLNAFEVEHYTFQGWATTGSGEVLYRDGDKISNLSFDNGAVIDLYAIWKANTYKVSYNQNQPKDRPVRGVMNDSTFEFDKESELPSVAYTLDGHTFMGWASSKTGEVVYTDKAKIKNITDEDGGMLELYAVWKPWTYTISFDKNDDAAEGTMAAKEMTFDVPAKLPKIAFTSNVYWFSGWSTKQDGSGSFFDDEETVNILPPSDGADIVLYAVWSDRDAFRVKFKDGDRVISSVQVYADNKVDRPTDPVKEGYDFAGWYTDESFESRFDFDTLINSNTEIYAKFEGYTFNVIFDANRDNAEGTMESVPMQNGVKVKLPAVGFSHSYYYFTNWNTEPDGSGESFKDKADVDFFVKEKTDNDITLYAQWELKLVVTFNTAGGDPSPVPQYITYGETAVKPETNPSKEGYMFVGWYKAGGEQAFNFGTKIRTDLVLTAQYLPRTYNIHFDSNDADDGEMDDMIAINYDERIKLPPNQFIKEDMVFIGWSEEKGGRVKYRDREVVWNLESTYKATHVLYAVWSKGIMLHLGYDLGDGIDTTVCRCEVGRPIDPEGIRTDPNNFEYSGYYFKGWYNAPEDGDYINMSSLFDGEIKDLWAYYDPVTYNITFHSNLDKDDTQSKTITVKSGNLDEQMTLDSIFGNNAQVNAAKDRFIEWSSLRNSYSSESTLSDLIAKESRTLINERSQTPVVNLDVYAKWAHEKDYIIVFLTDRNGAYDLERQALTLSDIDRLGFGHIERADYGEDIVLAGNELLRKGYTLKGYEYYDGKKTVTLAPSVTLKDLYTTGEYGGKKMAALKAIWKTTSYKITWNVDNGKVVSGTKNKTYNYESQYVLPTMSKKGFAFEGWFLDSEFTKKVTVLGIGAGASDGENSKEYGDVTLYAKFVPATYTVVLDKNDGDSDAEIEEYGPFDTFALAYNESLSLKPYKATWTGYKFKNWTAEWTENGVKKTKNFAASATIKNLTTVAGTEITLRANWTPINYTVSYSYGGGKLAGVKNPTKYTRCGTESAAVIYTPSRDGYEFEGWVLTQKQIADPERYTAILTPSGSNYLLSGYGNVTLKALWKEREYSIEYYSAQGDASPVYTSEKTYTFADTLTSKELAKAAVMIDAVDTAHNVTGFAKAGQSKASYLLKGSYKISKVAAGSPTDTIKLIAVKGERLNHIIYESDESTGEYTLSKNLFTFKQSSGNIALPKAVRKGHTFITWDGNGSLLTEDKKAIKAGVNEDVKVKPVFETNTYIVTIHPNGDRIIADNGVPVTNAAYKLASGAKINYSDGKVGASSAAEQLPSGWERYGYKLLGFAPAKSAKKAEFAPGSDAKELTTKASVTLYAIWQPDECLISYDEKPVIDGTSSGAFKIDVDKLPSSTVYAKKAVTLKKLSVTGYTFLGYELYEGDRDKASLTYDKSGYIKKVNKDNDTPLTLRACFKENTYRYVINPNGGMVFDPETAKYTDKPITYATLKYSEWAYIFGDLYKTGHYFRCFTTDKAGKKAIQGNRKFVSKNNGVFTVYAQWDKIDIQKPAVTADLSPDGNLSISVDGDTAYSYGYFENIPVLFYEVEYSTSIDFRYDVRTVKITKSSQNNKVTVSGLNGSVYYVRVRQWKEDSDTGVYGPYSKVVRAVKPQSAADPGH